MTALGAHRAPLQNMPKKILDSDIAKLYIIDEQGKKKLLVTLFWGDTIEVSKQAADHYVVPLTRFEWDNDQKKYVRKDYECQLSLKATFREDPLLKVRFVDVGQGDAAMIETPRGKRLIIDGGEEEHLRRYLNVAFSHILKTRSLHLDAIIVTHGDADHYSGLTKLINAKRADNEPFITAGRVFHNGLVKGPESKKLEMLGKTKKVNGSTYITELEDDVRKVSDTRMNKPFLEWKKALLNLTSKNGKPKVERLEYGQHKPLAFAGAQDLEFQVLGPIVEKIDGAPALKFLKEPGGGGLSVSHTINGHSIVLNLRYKNVRFLFGADLNEESEESLVERARLDNLSLSAEVLKVPHHGSADFSPRILEAIRPVVSVVSSGDENTTKEYIHPRAGLVGALGKYSRPTVVKPLIYVTEMVAFFARLKPPPVADRGKVDFHNLYRKTAFGIVHVRTDGERVLVVTHSGKDNQKESYTFRVDANGAVLFDQEVKIV